MGGINVYLQQKMPWLAYLPAWFDSFLNQSWIIRPLTKNAGKTSPQLLGGLTVSMLQGTEGRQRKEFRRLLDWLERDIKPDVMVFTNLLIGGGIPEVKRMGSTQVFVTLQGDDIFLDSLPEKYRTRAIELMQGLVRHIDGFLVHSEDYASRLGALLKIPKSKLHVIPLGIETSDFENTNRSIKSTGEFTLGYLARMAPEKGLHRLIDAFIAIADHPDAKHVSLKLAGWMGPQHEVFWEEQKTKLSRAGLDGRWEYLGSIDRAEKASFLSSIDLFCVPTTYTEPKGLFLLEAIASGTQYVQPNHGAFPEIHQRLQSIANGRHLGTLFQADSLDDLSNKLLAGIRTNQKNECASNAILAELGIERHAQRVLDCIR
jgi:glycosyltransferase involved in cell wall biosynthesis